MYDSRKHNHNSEQQISISKALNTAIIQALNETRNRCIISTEGRNLTHDQIVDGLALRGWQKIATDTISGLLSSTGQILERSKPPAGIIITGYRNDLSDLDTIERAIRAPGINTQSLGILVLSESLPSIDVFTSSERSWHNGPFNDRTPYNLAIVSGVVVLTRYERAGERWSEVEPFWKVKNERSFPISP